MTVEEQKSIVRKIDASIQLGKTIGDIIESFKVTTPDFKNHIAQFIHKILNEEELTQEFVNLLRRKTVDSSFLIGQEKKDLYHYSKGRADFYFYWKEETETTESFFDIEAKILTDRFTKDRAKEYVIGEHFKKDGTKEINGGIERYKLEKHGKGLFQCGMIGFIEKEDTAFWKTTINNWIEELSKSDLSWNKNEVLTELENQTEYAYLNSIAHTITTKEILLHHFWIK